MLVTNVSLRPPRAGIAADIAEVIEATDATATGNVVFATLVDDPANVGAIVDAYLGEIMLEAALAASTVNAGLAYAAAIVEAATATDTASASLPVAASVTETATAADAPDATVTAGGVWALAGSWTFSTTVANVDFTGLAGYSEIRVLLKSVSCSNPGVSPLLWVSTDNGSTFLTTSGDYVDVAGDGITTNVAQMSFINAGGTVSGEILIAGWNLTANKLGQYRTRTDVRQCVIPTSSALNALRVGPGTVHNLTGGSIYVFARS